MVPLTRGRKKEQATPMSDPAVDMLSEIRAFINEVNGGNGSGALARLTNDVCIVEDLAPFCWTGADAGGQWLAAMSANAQRLGVTSITMTPGEPRRIEVDGEHGYCIIPGRVGLEGPETALHEDGLITFALRRERGEWRISALTWTGDPPTAE
jgi:hypothetical protein